jgi:hypothetical protein
VVFHLFSSFFIGAIYHEDIEVGGEGRTCKALLSSCQFINELVGQLLANGKKRMIV